MGSIEPYETSAGRRYRVRYRRRDHRQAAKRGFRTKREAERYLISGRVGQAAGEEYGAPGDPERAFEFGLARVIDGIEAYVADSMVE